MTAKPETVNTDDTTSPKTPNQLLTELGELHVRTLVSPLPKHPAAMGWQATAGAMAASFARALHALNEVDPARAQQITDWFQGPFENEGPDPEEHTDWLERVVTNGNLAVMEQWVEEGRRLAQSSKEATDAWEETNVQAGRDQRLIAEVRAMHKRRTERHGSGCVQCGIVWPCPTYKALGGGQ